MSLGKGCHARLVSLDTDNLPAPTGQIPSAWRCVIVPITGGEERHQQLGTTLPLHLNILERGRRSNPINYDKSSQA